MQDHSQSMTRQPFGIVMAINIQGMEPSAVSLRFLTVLISIEYLFTDTESVEYTSQRGVDGPLASPLRGNSTIDVKFRDLIPGIVAEHDVLEEISLGMLSYERLYA